MKSQPAAGELPTGAFKWKSTHTGLLKYLVYVPPGFGTNRNEGWPLMLFLHGSGERGTNPQRTAIHGPLNLVKQGTNFPFIIIAPLCPAGEQWQNDSLLLLLDHVTKKFAVDESRVYLTGLSMGGYGTWNLAFAHPERFAAIAPVCGGGLLLDLIIPSDDTVRKLKALPIWAFHGGKDTVVPVEESEQLVNRLRELGVKNVKLTVYPNAKHNSWTETYNNPELYTWLLGQRRKGN